MKTLNQILDEIYGDRPLEGGEKEFVDRHNQGGQFGVINGKDYAGNDINGAPYKGTNKYYKRDAKHGYNSGADKAVYEDFDPTSKESYDAHHNRTISALKQLLVHLEDHKNNMKQHAKDKETMVTHPAMAMREVSSRAEDLLHHVKHNFSTEFEPVPSTLNQPDKNRVGGLKYSNYKART